MATNFPNGLDNLISPTAANVLDDPDPRLVHTTQHTNANDAINALQEKVGVDLANTQNSLDYICRLVLMVSNQHQSGGYREIDGFPFPQTVTWYTSIAKTVTLTEKTYVYSGTIVPSQIILRLYDGTVGNNVLRTITDTISYNGVFEISRTRSVT